MSDGSPTVVGVNEEWTEEQRVLLMALDAFKTTGHDYIVLVGGGQFGIRVDSLGAEFWLTNLIEGALSEPESEWQRHVDQWLTTTKELIARGPDPTHTEDEVRVGIRTRLYAGDHDPEKLTYARPFADGLVLGLALDFPTSVAIVTTKTLRDLPLDLDELFQLGQANTDQEAIDEVFDVADQGCRGLVGESHFVASRAANLPTLYTHLIGEPAHGVAFGVPNRHTLLFQVIDKDNWADVAGIIELVDDLARGQGSRNPGGVLSPYVYYWAPDRSVELLGGRLTELDGEMTLTVRPGVAFNRFVLGGE